jgi:hypothetical protein
VDGRSVLNAVNPWIPKGISVQKRMVTTINLWSPWPYQNKKAI